MTFSEWMIEAQWLRLLLLRDKAEILFRIRLIDATLAYNPLEERIIPHTRKR